MKERQADGLVSRRQMLKRLAAGGALMLGAPMINIGRFRVFAADARQYSVRTIDLVGRCIVIDMLSVVTLKQNLIDTWISGAGLSTEELEDFRASGITALHHSWGIGGPNAREDAITYLARYNGFVARLSEHFGRIDRVADFARMKSAGKVGLIMGLQNAEQFRTADDVRFFHGLGLRCAQLTYNSQNLIGSGSTERGDGGVSDFGAEIIKQMNEVGMLVDVSHCADRTTLDAIELSGKPIAITHSNCRALNNHPRLKTDEAIKKLAARGGVMGITGVRMFVRDKEPTTVEHIVDHIDHVRKIAGIEHVGIGSDCDLRGYDDLPEAMRQQLRAAYKSSYAFRDKIDTDGFGHPRKMFDLTEALIRRGYSDAHIEAILGGNFLRLLDAVWNDPPESAP